MAPTDQLIAELRRERFETVSPMTFEQRFLAGAELFDYACEVARSSIQAQQPQWTERQVLDEIRRRIEIAQKLRERR